MARAGLGCEQSELSRDQRQQPVRGLFDGAPVRPHEVLPDFAQRVHCREAHEELLATLAFEQREGLVLESRPVVRVVPREHLGEAVAQEADDLEAPAARHGLQEVLADERLGLRGVHVLGVGRLLPVGLDLFRQDDAGRLADFEALLGRAAGLAAHAQPEQRGQVLLVARQLVFEGGVGPGERLRAGREERLPDAGLDALQQGLWFHSREY